MTNEYRSRWERLDLICREKFDISLPKALRENQIDMWIHVVKLGNPDALALESQEGHVDLDMMTRYLLGVAMGVNRAPAHPARKPVQPISP